MHLKSGIDDPMQNNSTSDKDLRYAGSKPITEA
jgi:hypothetical protein